MLPQLEGNNIAYLLVGADASCVLGTLAGLWGTLSDFGLASPAGQRHRSVEDTVIPPHRPAGGPWFNYVFRVSS